VILANKHSKKLGTLICYTRADRPASGPDRPVLFLVLNASKKNKCIHMFCNKYIYIYMYVVNGT
jgi:hypothetical protein